MGAASSNYSATEIIQNSVTDVLMQNSSTCNQSNTNTQAISLEGAVFENCEVDIGRINQTMNISSNFTCDQLNMNNADLQNKLEQAIKKNLESEANAGLGIAVSQNVSLSSSLTNVVNNINMSNIANCAANAMQSQNLNMSKIKITCTDKNPRANIHDITQSIISNVVSNCLQTNPATVTAINSLQTKIDETAKASATGLFGGEMFAGIMGIIILIIVIGVAGKFLMDRQNSSPQMYYDTQYVDYQQPPQFSNYDQYPQQYQQNPQYSNYDQYQQQPLLQPTISPLTPANLNVQPVVQVPATNGQTWTL